MTGASVFVVGIVTCLRGVSEFFPGLDFDFEDWPLALFGVRGWGDLARFADSTIQCLSDASWLIRECWLRRPVRRLKRPLE